MNATQPTSLILASSSPRRQELLAVLGIPFTVKPSHADETTPPEWNPERTVTALAERKAMQVYDSLAAPDKEGVIIVGSDTVVVRDGVILGKPADEQEALSMIASLQGRDHLVFTGVALVNSAGQILVRSSTTRVTMKQLSSGEMEAYVRSGEGLDKAGAYGIQGLGATIVTGIEGDYFTVVGLPLSLLAEMLGEMGLQVLN